MNSDRAAAWQDAELLLLCLIISLAALGTIVWVIVNRQLLNPDSMLLTGSCLVFILAFGGNVAWSIRTGEAQSVLRELLKTRKGHTHDN